MFLVPARVFFSLVLSLPIAALAQPVPAPCDLTHLTKPKPHLTFSDPYEDISATLAKAFADPRNGTGAFQQALKAAQQQKDICGEALAEYGLAAAIDPTHHAEIEPHLLRAAELFAAIEAKHALAQTHYMLGRLKQRSGKAGDGAELARQAAKEFDETGDREHAIGAKLSAILMVQGSPAQPEMLSLLDEARALHSAGTEGSILHLWGDQEFQAGHFDGALQHYQQARKVLQACACDNEALATLLVSMGRLERLQGQPQLALKDYEAALSLQRAAGEREYILQTMNAMAVAYDAMGERARSLSMYQKALAQAKLSNANQFIPFLEGNIGGQYLKMQQYDKAAKQLQMVIAKHPSDYLLCIRNNQLSDALLHLHRQPEAYAAADEGVNTCNKQGDKDSMADALEARAIATSAHEGYEKALADVRQAMAIREDIRSHLVPDDARKQGYNERIQDLYDVSIEILTKMGRSREALETAEKGRARAFLDLMGTQAAGANADPDAPAVDAPSFASYVSAAPFTADEMVEAARHYNSTLIAYWTSDKALYIWVLSNDGEIHETKVPVVRKRIAALVSRTLDPPAEQSAPATQVANNARGAAGPTIDVEKSLAWRTLYSLLIAPVSRYLPRQSGSLLTIIPHHELFRLSFAALTDAHGSYLVARYALHTVPASALLRYTQQNERKAEALPERYVLVANPNGATLTNGATLPRLPATLTEVRAIASLLPSEKEVVLTGSDSQQQLVTDALHSATVAHFAMHAVLDDADPRRSFLLFSADPNHTSGARVTSADIYELKLHTRLVVLSACRTGLGKITGDGIDGFSRAFFYAGTASFLATLWDVADEPTAQLLPRFYRELLSGKPKAEALRTAQLALIRALREKKVKANTALGPVTLPENPTFWAAFSLSGEP